MFVELGLGKIPAAGQFGAAQRVHLARKLSPVGAQFARLVEHFVVASRLRSVGLEEG